MLLDRRTNPKQEAFWDQPYFALSLFQVSQLYQVPYWSSLAWASPGYGVIRKEKHLTRSRPYLPMHQSWPISPKMRRTRLVADAFPVGLGTILKRMAHTGQFITPAVSWVTWKTVLPVLEGSSSSTMGLSEILPLYTWDWLWDLYRS